MGGRSTGIIILVLGVVLLMFGVNAAEAPVDRVSAAFTGHLADGTMLVLTFGTVAVVGGLVMMMSRRSF